MDVMEYRRLHCRCRTCQHAKDFGLMWNFWTCLAKNKRHTGQLNQTVCKGMFCPVYLARRGEDDRVG